MQGRSLCLAQRLTVLSPFRTERIKVNGFSVAKVSAGEDAVTHLQALFVEVGLQSQTSAMRVRR